MKPFIDLVQGQLESYNERNLEQFCSFYHPQIQVRFLISDELISSGMNDFKEIYKNLFSKYPNQVCILKTRIIKSDCIIDEELIMGRTDYPDGLEAVAIYSFRDGLIDRAWFI